MALRTNRPAPPPPSKNKKQTFSSYVGNDTNNNPKINPTVIRPGSKPGIKKKPPPRPAPPKSYQHGGGQRSSAPPDLLADLNDIFGPSVTTQPSRMNSNRASALPNRMGSSQRWKKAQAPPKPSNDLIDFDSFQLPSAATASSQSKPILDLLTSDPFDSPIATAKLIHSNRSTIGSALTTANLIHSNKSTITSAWNTSSSVMKPLTQTLSSASSSDSFSSPTWSDTPKKSIFSPPEPKFPPPPAPTSVIEQNSGDSIRCKALFDFSASDPEELTFFQDDSITLIEKVSSDWWKGSIRGKIGLFPATYVQLQESETPKFEETTKDCLVTALYHFNAEQDQDLTFKAGDSVQVLYRINQNWLYGKCGAKQGQFPANFVQKQGTVSNVCTAKYQFQGANSDEISFDEGHVIVIVEKISSDWWKGYRSNDAAQNCGLFPASFVEETS